MRVKSRYTDGTYLSDTGDWHEGDAEWKARHVLEMLDRADYRPSSICDIGCGSGGLLAYLHQHLRETGSFTGYDISPQAISLAKNKTKADLEFYSENFFDHCSKRFDMILLIDVFEHVPDYLGFLERCRPYADCFIFHIPLELSALWIMREWPILRRRRSVGHLHHFSKATALETLQYCGYTINDSFYTASGFQPHDCSLKATIRDLPKKMMFHLNADFTVKLMGGYSLMVRATPRQGQLTRLSDHYGCQ